ncbi:unnamed protein product [Cuscuta campestris]|uniref:Late embryogenesis abundant protein LEA-2 subgroup domain-containing protein n=1 Tax=Cuscuta campestris TaxID=132261 RepID=A0A484LCT2_9ASTE|nr:unnamed protein product [Cuscuta campestris]
MYDKMVAYHNRGRGGDGGCCCCCNLLTCCCGCLFECILSCIIKILCVAAVVAAAVFAVAWFVFRRHAPQFYADSVSLTLPHNQNKSHAPIVSYLAVNVSVRNPNRGIGFYYDKVEATTTIAGQRFSTAELHPFFQRGKNTTELHLVFKDRNRTWSEEMMRRRNGGFDISLKIHVRMRVKVLVMRVKKVNSTIECDLKNVTSSSPHDFEKTRCNYQHKLDIFK